MGMDKGSVMSLPEAISEIVRCQFNKFFFDRVRAGQPIFVVGLVGNQIDAVFEIEPHGHDFWARILFGTKEALEGMRDVLTEFHFDSAGKPVFSARTPEELFATMHERYSDNLVMTVKSEKKLRTT